ncbi:Phage head-tail joining protein [Sulfitobacter sp. THAF37]|uniref:head-tail adaptor protein n=1 Tax=Sulfitobacter sp. THAF37 TaxID=2587855 RepID=UPI0012697F87|nr:head-tail adaptor protein [Sulfitobacter sp. THAF37]QFT59652.1 Phage head-tail joining protein [Sulfitobacter sp. THAF37]
MSLPRLSHALVLETPERLPDGAGGFVEGWLAVGTLWAEINARTGRETGSAGALVSRAGFRIVVRGAPFGSPERPRAQQRLRDGQRIFNITAVTERDPEGRYLICHAEEERVA